MHIWDRMCNAILKFVQRNECMLRSDEINIAVLKHGRERQQKQNKMSRSQISASFSAPDDYVICNECWPDL
jgi:hypothetical protein